MIKIRSFDLNSNCVCSVMTQCLLYYSTQTCRKCSAIYAAITLNETHFILIAQAIEKWLARMGGRCIMYNCLQ